MKSNLILTSGFSRYLSDLIRGNLSDMYFSVGSGNASWESNLPTPSRDINKLTNELYRYKVDLEDIEFVNPSDEDEVSNVPTSLVRVKVKINSDDFYGVIREYGLFTIDANEELDSGNLILYCNHSTINIPNDVIYEKYIYINT